MRASLRTLALCLALASAMQPTQAQTYTPLNLDQTVELIGGGLTSKRIVTLIAERGVDYRLTPTAIERLKLAHADVDEIAAIGTNYRAPAPQPAPATKPNASSASLADTLQFIQTEMNQQGPVRWSNGFHDRDGKLGDGTIVRVATVSAAVASPSTCRIDYHWKIVQNGEVRQDFDTGFYLSNVVNVSVPTAEQDMRRTDTANGHPDLDYTFSPNVYWVSVATTSNDIDHSHFPFYDQAEADRVSAAIIHAAKLCGGAKGVF